MRVRRDHAAAVDQQQREERPLPPRGNPHDCPDIVENPKEPRIWKSTTVPLTGA